MIALAAALLVLAACEEDEEQAPPAQGGGVFVELLGLLPDRQEIRANVEMGDVQRAREALGVDVPPEAVDGKFNGQGFGQYVQALIPPISVGSAPANVGRSPAVDLRFFLSGNELAYTFALAEATHASMGISPFDVDQWITGGDEGATGPGEWPRKLHAVRGDFDPGALDSRLKECSACVAATVADRRGWRIYSWGADFEADMSRRLQPPMFDHAGRGGRLAVSDRVLMRALSTPDIHAMVDAAEGTGSLADNDDFRLAAEGLQRLGTWNATITERTLGPWQGEAIGGLLRPYAVMAHGDRYGDGKRYFAVALVHRTAEDAAENARRLPARIGPAQRAVAEQAARISGRVAEWDKVISDVDVETDGRLLLATLRFDEFDPSGGFGSFFLRLLAHE